jgi:exosortase E/protease (VPEID-CTERM system)
LANVCRIAALVLIGEYYSPQLALGGFHSQAGAFAFAAIGLTLVAVARRSKWFSKTADTHGSASPAAPYVMPLIGLLAAAMVTRAVTQGFDGLYPMRVASVAAILWYYHGHLLSRPVHSSQPLAPSRAEAAYVAFVGVLVFVLWIALEPLAGDLAGTQQSHADPSKVPPIWAAIWLPFRIIGCVVTVPIAEELAFRGYLLRRLAHADFAHSSYQQVTWFAVVASSAAFGLLHGRWLAGTLAGILYAHAANRGGHVSHAIVAHGITNLLITVYVCSTGQWSQWG